MRDRCSSSCGRNRRSGRFPICAGGGLWSGRERAAWCSTPTGALGMSFSDFSPVYLDFAAGAAALAAGDVDAQFQCPIPNAVMTDLAQRVALRVLPYQRGELEAVMQAAPPYAPH